MRIVLLLLLLALLTVCDCNSITVDGLTGHSITLPCKYDRQSSGERSICWNRGQIPTRGCDNKLIATGSYREKEETSESSRYQLLGRVDDGDVSLTILNLTETDAGRYGCRVDIPGWFNDNKHHFDLRIEKATTASSENSTDATTEPTAAAHTPGQMTPTAGDRTSSSSSSSTDTVVHVGSSPLTAVLASVLLGLVALVTVVGIAFMARRWKQVVKMPQQVNGSVRFNSTSSTLQLNHRTSVVENIYQIDGGGEGGEYEYCP